MNNNHINRDNVDAIKNQIAYKLNYSTPFYATIQNATATITDQDQFPYQRYFRGVYNDTTPTVMEREAGWRPRYDDCYKQIVTPTYYRPNFCWEGPCSTIYPCNPEMAPNPPASYVRLPGNNVIFSP
jgi:hypothetical protein